MQLRPAVGVPIDANFLTINDDPFGKFALGIFWVSDTGENHGQD